MHGLRVNQQFQTGRRVRAVELTARIVVVKVVDCQRRGGLIDDAREVLPAEVDVRIEREVAASGAVESPEDGAVRRDEVG